MIKKLLNSLPGRLMCAAAVIFMVAGLFVGGSQPVAVGLCWRVRWASAWGCGWLGGLAVMGPGAFVIASEARQRFNGLT